MSVASPGTRLREVAAMALIGADRAGGGAGTAGKMLGQAAVLGAQGRAGWRPGAVARGVERCPAETLPRASAAALATLMRVVGEGDGALIEEWAECANQKGVCVAPEVVPAVLEWWARQTRRDEAVFKTMGVRGAWLSSMNPVWRKASAGVRVPDDVEGVWQTGSVAERLGALSAVRASDPARGREMVQSTWQSDGADERRRFVEALAEGCALADELFLEVALDDKSKVVRRAAVSALGRLPGSRLRERMNERARQIITVEAKGGVIKRRPKVSLSPPSAFEKAWERDGIEEPAPGGVGKRAWWMRQILAATDLSVWTALTGLSPEDVLDALALDDYYDDAISALQEAVGIQRDPAWCRAIARPLLERKKVEVDDLAALVLGAGREHGETLLLEVVDHKRFSAGERWGLLASTEHRWSRAFSESVMARMEKHVRKQGAQGWGLHEPVDAVSRRVDPACADAFERAVVAMFADEPTDSFKKSIDRVRLRAEMRKEFES